MKSKALAAAFILACLIPFIVMALGANPVKQGAVVSESDSQEKDEFKKDAVRADFASINNNESDELGKKVFVTGEVTNIIAHGELGEFIIATKEDSGYGTFRIENYSNTEVNEGDSVTVYGIVMPKGDDGLPTISARFIE